MKKRIIITLSTVVVAMSLLSGCNKSANEQVTIRMIASDGIAQAPLFLISEFNIIKKYADNAKVDFKAINSGSVINEAFIANQVDIAAFGFSNFAIGFDKGIPYKIASAVSYGRFGLQTNNPNIKTLRDVGTDDRVALPSLTGINGILFYMACEKEFGTHKALEDNIIAMDGEVAELALINRSSGISLHMDNLGVILRENLAGCPTILDSADILGGTGAGVVSVATIDFVNKHPDLYDAYLLSLEDAVSLINNRDEQAIEFLTKTFNMSQEDILESLDNGSLYYSTSDYNILPISDFLYRAEMISNKIDSLRDVSFPNVVAE